MEDPLETSDVVEIGTALTKHQNYVEETVIEPYFCANRVVKVTSTQGAHFCCVHEMLGMREMVKNDINMT